MSAHTYTCHNYIRHNYTGHDCILHNYIRHNYVGLVMHGSLRCMHVAEWRVYALQCSALKHARCTARALYACHM